MAMHIGYLPIPVHENGVSLISWVVNVDVQIIHDWFNLLFSSVSM